MYTLPARLPRPVQLYRPLYVADISLDSENGSFTLSSKGGGLPRETFLYGFELEFEGRLAVGTAAADSEHADSPYSIVEEILVEGQHKVRGDRDVLYRLRGPEIRQLAMLYGQRAPGTTGALGVGTGNKDFRFQLPIIFPPERLPKPHQVGFLLDSPNYNDLVLTVKWGDGKSVLNPAATTTYTFTAFGSATGKPRCRVTALETLFGKGFRPLSFLPARVHRYFKEVSGSALTTTASETRLYDLVLGNWIRSVLVKTGVKDTEVTSGLNAFGTLSNAILDSIKLSHGIDDNVRHFKSFTQFREFTAKQFGITPDTGYAMFDFAPDGDVGDVFATQTFVRDGAELFIRAGVTGAANQAALFAVQEIRGVPIVR